MFSLRRHFFHRRSTQFSQSTSLQDHKSRIILAETDDDYKHIRNWVHYEEYDEGIAIYKGSRTCQ